ncbi:hypothetical protein NTE_01515 [Candidatus Nitrososphaera evergladensis SR1]|uniref:Uncharacterized protein n=1 Tax=Candidatus Nitrososphaera evergladensis SR1 TaxID=1459636 RepID=A0A075MQU3_9ARCH|nr:hypothetical protein NTE_01515 [Candidatus Nitrososphaera evergladensis SR1]
MKNEKRKKVNGAWRSCINDLLQPMPLKSRFSPFDAVLFFSCVRMPPSANLKYRVSALSSSYIMQFYYKKLP